MGRLPLLGREAELGRSSAAVGMEFDLAGRRGERGWLATLWRLLLWGFQTLSPVSIPKLEQEAILTP